MAENTKNIGSIENVPGVSETREEFEERVLAGMKIIQKFGCGAAIEVAPLSGASLSIGIVQEEKVV